MLKLLLLLLTVFSLLSQSIQAKDTRTTDVTQDDLLARMAQMESHILELKAQNTVQNERIKNQEAELKNQSDTLEKFQNLHFLNGIENQIHKKFKNCDVVDALSQSCWREVTEEWVRQGRFKFQFDDKFYVPAIAKTEIELDTTLSEDARNQAILDDLLNPLNSNPSLRYANDTLRAIADTTPVTVDGEDADWNSYMMKVANLVNQGKVKSCIGKKFCWYIDGKIGVAIARNELRFKGGNEERYRPLFALKVHIEKDLKDLDVGSIDLTKISFNFDYIPAGLINDYAERIAKEETNFHVDGTPWRNHGLYLRPSYYANFKLHFDISKNWESILTFGTDQVSGYESMVGLDGKVMNDRNLLTTPSAHLPEFYDTGFFISFSHTKSGFDLPDFQIKLGFTEGEWTPGVVSIYDTVDDRANSITSYLVDLKVDVAQRFKFLANSGVERLYAEVTARRATSGSFPGQKFTQDNLEIKAGIAIRIMQDLELHLRGILGEYQRNEIGIGSGHNEPNLIKIKSEVIELELKGFKLKNLNCGVFANYGKTDANDPLGRVDGYFSYINQFNDVRVHTTKSINGGFVCKHERSGLTFSVGVGKKDIDDIRGANRSNEGERWEDGTAIDDFNRVYFIHVAGSFRVLGGR